MSIDQLPDITRRRLLHWVTGAGLAAPFVVGSVSAYAFTGGRSVPAGVPWDSEDLCLTPASASSTTIPVRIRVAWNTGAVCGAPIAAGKAHGIYAKHGIDVEFINFAGSTESLLEAIATGKAEAGVGMALRWLKPLEQGFDVRIVAGLHSGCLRLLVAEDGGINTIADLRGKTVAIADLSSPAKHFFSIQLAKQGIDPEAEVDWRVFPGELLGAVIDRGEAQGIAHWDPLTYQFLKSGKLVEIASNMEGPHAHRACCIIGVQNRLVQEDKAVVTALVRASLEAQHFTTENPRLAAEAYQPFSPKTSIEDLEAQIRYHGHDHSPAGEALKNELAQYTEELKLVGVIRERTDAREFANRIFAHVL
jgi:NitT/TauT family transport system substrate-binding protein